MAVPTAGKASILEYAKSINYIEKTQSLQANAMQLFWANWSKKLIKLHKGHSKLVSTLEITEKVQFMVLQEPRLETSELVEALYIS